MINSLTRMPVTIYFRPRGQHIRLYMYIVHLDSNTFLQIHKQNKPKAKLSFTLEKQTVFFWTRAKEHHFWSQDIDPTQKSIAIRPSFLYICCVATMISAPNISYNFIPDEVSVNECDNEQSCLTRYTCAMNVYTLWCNNLITATDN